MNVSNILIPQQEGSEAAVALTSDPRLFYFQCMNPRDQVGASLLSLSFHRIKRLPRPPGQIDQLSERDPRPSVFKTGRTIWRAADAERVSFLIDADAFFRAFAEAAARAERQIIIVGWDTDSRTEIPRPEGFELAGPSREERLRLGDFLSSLAEKKPELRIHVLSWDFAFIYLFERETLPGVRYSTLGHDRFRIVLDNEHPFWGSHHQKIVVIDDEVAFSGGLDITARRWDTTEHRGVDERRVDPWGEPYGPFHDVQICVDGAAAKALGDLVRERWSQATGETLVATEGRSDPWPPSAEVAMRNVEVGIARTIPFGYGASTEERPVVEVERLFLEMIRSARRFLYIENQYFTSPVIAKALAKRLEEDDGPEVVMVLPRDQTGWIEESTMGLLRSQALRIVENADRHKRFRCFYPVVPNLGEGYVKVHSKVMIVDDQIVRVGSANLNSRSMGLDTECDLVIEARGRKDVSEAISQLRAELLGEHLGVEAEEFEARRLMNGSLVDTVESFRGGPRTFVEMRPNIPEWLGRIAPPTEWIDPTGPRGIRRWFAKRVALNRRQLGAVFIFAALIGLLLLSELEETRGIMIAQRDVPDIGRAVARAYLWVRSLDAERIAALLEGVRNETLTIPLVLAGFVIGSFLFVPITAMILGVSFAFPRWEAMGLALGGSALAALATYGLGRYWAWTKSRFLARPWIQRLSRQISRGGVGAMMIIRMAPIAPFTAVSIVAGGLRVPVVSYMLGSIFGMLPGIVAITVLAQEAASKAGAADWSGLGLVAFALALFFLGIPYGVRHLRQKQVERSKRSPA